MQRNIEKKLLVWKDSPYRKPLILRGARQVGKTYSINDFGKKYFENHITFDFEQEKRLAAIFDGDLRPERIIMQLEVHAGQRIIPGKTLVFFDEIQTCPTALQSLRYFYEQMPGLHVIAAGSLLEFAMGGLSFPVGRVEFTWMMPMTFAEFLEAKGKNLLAEKVPSLKNTQAPDAFTHEMLLGELKLYFLTGGMPEAVARFIETGSFEEVRRVHDALIQSYLQSFLKYNSRADIESLEFVLRQIPTHIGRQVKYSAIDPERRIEKTKNSIQILERSLIVSQVISSHANGLPLSADADMKAFKLLFLDIGLMQHLCGIDPNSVLNEKNILHIYRGALAEQFVGQELLAGETSSGENRLYYWSRNKKSSNAEVDYLIVRDGIIYPVEVKSGPAGKLKSMHLFLSEHPGCGEGIVLSSSLTEKNTIDGLTFFPIYVVLD
jgi:predicted AAA+ superfamily ATPase